jgi:hypothetical protein
MENRGKLSIKVLNNELQHALNGSEERIDRTVIERDSFPFYEKGDAGTSLCIRFHIMGTIKE